MKKPLRCKLGFHDEKVIRADYYYREDYEEQIERKITTPRPGVKVTQERHWDDFYCFQCQNIRRHYYKWSRRVEVVRT